MDSFDIWRLNKVHIKTKEIFLRFINYQIRKKFGSKLKFYFKLEYSKTPYQTFKNYLKYSYYKNGYFAPLELFIIICNKLNISKKFLQTNIESYKTANGYNIIENPILPIKITPVFDMIFAHNIADGTVINSKRNRQIYFGYRQFDEQLRLLYIKKLESVFGNIKYKSNYFIKSTRPYCPAVLSSLFFLYYNLNSKSFLSIQARIPKKLLNKNKEHLLAVLLAFIIDEGNVDSTDICIRLKNIDLTKDLYEICLKIGYECTFKSKNEYGSLYIKRMGMKKLFKDYQKLIKKYPSVNIGKLENKISDGFKIYDREIYKTRGNKEIILNMIKSKDLTVNQIAQKINMTRQGVRFHIHNLENIGLITKTKLIGRRNIVYNYRK